MKRFTLMTLVSLMLMAFAATAMAAEPVACNKAKINSFDFLVDYSGSMMMKYKPIGENKFKLARKVLHELNDRIPELGYNGSLHTFSNPAEVLKQQTYNRAVFKSAIDKMKNDYEVFNRLTRMGDGIHHWSDRVYTDMATPAAVILVSDGASNRGADALAACQAALAANPDLTFHVISFADTDKGQALLDEITALGNGKSVMVRAEDLLKDEANMDQFVKQVFCSGGITLRSVQFALNSSHINSESASVLNELGNILKDRNVKNVQIAGHTCSLGSEAYNQRLSERRASSAKAYLAKRGIPANIITTRGYGESMPKFDNSTEKGRRMNRRVEIDFN